MALYVLGQVVGAHEATRAHVAAELLLPRVRPLVPGQFVRPAEAAAAVRPGAQEGPLARVGACVCLQVRGLEVILAAGGMRALVLPAALRGRAGQQ